MAKQFPSRFFMWKQTNLLRSNNRYFQFCYTIIIFDKIDCYNRHNCLIYHKISSSHLFCSVIMHVCSIGFCDGYFRSGYLAVPSNLVWYTAPELVQAAKASQLTQRNSFHHAPDDFPDSSSAEEAFSIDHRPSTIGFVDMSSPFSSVETIASDFEHAAYQYR